MKSPGLDAQRRHPGRREVGGDGLSVSPNTDVSHGTLALNPDGSITYTPNWNYCGPDSFSYIATDDPPAIGPSLPSN